jgi:hypothetical protein
LPELTDDLLETLIAGFGRVNSPLSAVLIEHSGGAVSRVPQAASAYDHRDSEYNLALISRWPDPAMADDSIAWIKQLWTETERFGRGVYVNYLGVGESQDRVRAAYGPEKHDRLVALKRQYDPGNLFRHNQNIKP